MFSVFLLFCCYFTRLGEGCVGGTLGHTRLRSHSRGLQPLLLFLALAATDADWLTYIRCCNHREVTSSTLAQWCPLHVQGQGPAAKTLA